MANTHDQGDLVRMTGVFTTADIVVDPTTVAVTVKTPAGALSTKTYVTDAEVIRDSEGTYHYDLSITESGTYRYRWVSTGTGQAAEESWFHVRTKRTA